MKRFLFVVIPGRQDREAHFAADLARRFGGAGHGSAQRLPLSVDDPVRRGAEERARDQRSDQRSIFRDGDLVGAEQLALPF